MACNNSEDYRYKNRGEHRYEHRYENRCEHRCENRCENRYEDEFKECRELYRRSQCALDRANRMLREADNEIDRVVLRGIVCAIEGLKKALEEQRKAFKIKKEVLESLEESECPISEAMEECRCFLRKIVEEIKKEERELFRALEDLEHALYHINESKKFRRLGEEFEEKYRRCVLRQLREC